METLRLVKKLESIQNLTAAESRACAAAFNNSEGIVGCLKDYLSHNITGVDKKLDNMESLYAHNNAPQYVASLLAERSVFNKLLALLTEKVQVLDNDPSGD